MDISLIICLLLAAAVCFFGYKLKRIAFGIIWFIVGFNLATVALPYILPYLGYLDQFWISLLPYLVAGIFAFIGIAIERIAIMLAGIVVTYFTYCTLAQQGLVPFDLLGNILALAIGGVVGAIAVKLEKPAVIALTAFIGAGQIATSILALIGLTEASIWYLIIFAIFVICGFLYQSKSCKHL